MARQIQFDRSQYSRSTGLIPLRLGDDWSIQANVIDTFPGNYNRPVDLTGKAATAFFPAATGGVIAADVVNLNAECGSIRINLDQALTPGVSTSEDGLGIYIVFEDGGELETVESVDQALEILERRFAQA